MQLLAYMADASAVSLRNYMKVINDLELSLSFNTTMNNKARRWTAQLGFATSD